MRGRSLHIRMLLVLAATAAALSAMLALALSSGALAANPHDACSNYDSARVLTCHFSGTDVDPDFCDTGKGVDIAFDGRFTIPLAPSAGESWNNSNGTTVLTNPENGATVLIHSAYRFAGTLLSGDPNGLHTFRWAFRGGAEVIRDPAGGVIARDAGNLVVVATFDGDEFVSVEIVSDRGGHELFANGDCGVLVPALGLP